MRPAAASLSTKEALKRFWPLIGVAAAMALVFWLGAHELLTLEYIVAQRDRFHGLLAEHFSLAVLTYVLIYAAAVTLSIPCGLVSDGGGRAAVRLADRRARRCRRGHNRGHHRLSHSAHNRRRILERARSGPGSASCARASRRTRSSYMLFLRLVPAFPFWFVNIAPALLGVPLTTYVIGTILGIIPATFAFASAGAGLDSVVMAAKKDYAVCAALKGLDACKMKIHASSLLTKELMLAFVLLGLVALIPVGLKKWRKTHGAAK